MKIALSWLQDFIDLTTTDAQVIADKLTAAGVEVDSCAPVCDLPDSIVVAKIKEKKQHPGADRLSLCLVTDGQTNYDIVCGATNMKAGDHVALAKIGSVLPGDFKIKKSKIRGETSEGMLCSTKEIGLGEDADGILILPEDSEPGTPLVKQLALDDVVIDIEITPNRGDLLSAVGLARELAAIGLGELKTPAIIKTLKKSYKDSVFAGASKGAVAVDVKNPQLAPQYLLQQLDLDAMPASPNWMVKRLEASGLRAINLVVDITNYVLLEWGQPLHAFDLDKLNGQKIHVRIAKDGEVIRGLDAIDHKLIADDLAICDDKGPVCIAGVMGGLHSGVTETTRKIVLEAATFDPSSVRRTAKRLGLSTDSSYRFERSVDPGVTPFALAKACQLLTELAGARIVNKTSTVNHLDKSTWTAREPIAFRSERFDRIIGQQVHVDWIEKHLTSLGCDVKGGRGGEFKVLPPSWRFDLHREIDLIEEVIRLEGYDVIPSTLPAGPPDAEITQSFSLPHTKLQHLMQAKGFHEVKNLSFISEADLAKLGAVEAVRLKNPIGDDLSVMRPSLAPQLIENLKFNLTNRGSERFLAFYEINRVFFKGKEGQLPNERVHIGGVGWHGTEASWRPGNSPQTDVFWIKQLVENIAEILAVKVKFSKRKQSLKFISTS